MDIILKDSKTGFIYKEVGCKINYGIFHRDEPEDKQLGWIIKAAVKHMVDKELPKAAAPEE
jgi:hypothetical protein